MEPEGRNQADQPYAGTRNQARGLCFAVTSGGADGGHSGGPVAGGLEAGDRL